METKNYIFKNAQVGDRVWDFVLGWGTINSIKEKSDFPLTVRFDYKEGYYVYTIEGKEFGSDLHPRLFWDEIKFEIPEKSFDLESELKKLEITEFRHGKNNNFLVWSNEFEKIDFYYFNSFQNPSIICFTKESIRNFMKIIKNKNITKEEFFSAYKKVFG